MIVQKNLDKRGKMKIHIIGGPGSGKTFLAELYYKNKKRVWKWLKCSQKGQLNLMFRLSLIVILEVCAEVAPGARRGCPGLQNKFCSRCRLHFQVLPVVVFLHAF